MSARVITPDTKENKCPPLTHAMFPTVSQLATWRERRWGNSSASYWGKGNRIHLEVVNVLLLYPDTGVLIWAVFA